MAISLSWCGVFISNVDNFPYWPKIIWVLLFAQVQNIELIFEQPLIAWGSAAVDYHLHIRYSDCRMGCPLWGDKVVFEVEFRPSWELKVVEVGLISNHEFALMKASLPDIETAPPKSTALVLETIVNVCPKRGAGMSPETFTFSTCSFFILKINVQKL
jgi:hypothetical protein